MYYRLVIILIALIPLALMQSCSTRPTVKGSAAPGQTTAMPEQTAAPRTGSGPYQPHYGHSADDGDALFGTFPRPKPLEAQVKFWRDVYSTWGRSQVAIHDDQYLNVVYEVLDLPGFTLEGMTAYQKEYVRERMNFWRDRLNGIEAKYSARLPLSSEEQRVAQLFAQCEEGEAALLGASERVRYQRGIREKFRRGLEISGIYEKRFREIFRGAGLPEDLVYLPHVESSYQANARSSAGALGIWQFTPGAARMFMNGDDSARARLDPIASAYGAARYLSYAYDKLGSWPLAVTSYNHGIGGMQRAKNIYGHNFSRIVKDYDHPLFGFASRNYYAEFLAAREIASQPDRFFPEGVMYAKDSDWTLSRLAAAEDEPKPRSMALAEDPIPRVVRASHSNPPVRRAVVVPKQHKLAVHGPAVVKGRGSLARQAVKPTLAKAKPGKTLAPVKLAAHAATPARLPHPVGSGPRKVALVSKPSQVSSRAAAASRPSVATSTRASLQKLKIARR